MKMNNDNRIIELKRQIEIKRDELLAVKQRFVPETNCVLELEGTTYNLNVCTADTLKFLLIRLNAYLMSAQALQIKIPEISGYDIAAWMSDIDNKIHGLNIKEEENKLKQMESKLNKLLSDDKKTELKIDEIASLLGK